MKKQIQTTLLDEIREPEPENWLQDNIIVAYDKRIFNEKYVLEKIRQKHKGEQSTIWKKSPIEHEMVIFISKLESEQILYDNEKAINILARNQKFDEPLDSLSTLNQFVLECKLPENSSRKIEETLQKVSNFLEDNKIICQIEPTLFIDPEFPDWEMIKIRIKIKEELEIIYDKFKEPIYDIFSSSLSDEIMENIMIKFEKLE